MPYPNQHAARLTDPKDFDPDSFGAKKIGDGITLMMGRREGSKTTEGMSYRFDKEKFTPEEAKDWLAEHKIDYTAFEPAEDPQPDHPIEATQLSNGTYRLSGVQILATGTFSASKGGEVTFTEADLDKIVQATQENIDTLRPPVKLGHGEQSFPKGGAPAFGWISGVRRVGTKILAELTAVPKAMYEAIQLGRYRTRSAEVIQNWSSPDGKKHDLVVKALAFLGAEMPAIQTLEDLVKLEADSKAVIEFAVDQPMPEIAPEPPANDQGTNDSAGDGGAIATEMQVTCPNCGQEIIISATGELITETQPSDAEDATDVVPEGDEQAMTEQEKALTAERDALKAKLIEVNLAALVRDRRLTPAQAEAQKETLFALNIDLCQKQLDVLVQNPQLPDLTTPGARQGDPPTTPEPKKGEERLVELTHDFMAKGLSSQDALIAAYKADPDAAKVYEATAFPYKGPAPNGGAR